MERIYSCYTKQSKEVIFLRDSLTGRFHMIFTFFPVVGLKLLPMVGFPAIAGFFIDFWWEY